MKDIGSPNYIPDVRQTANVAVHRVEKQAQKATVSVSRTPVVQNHHTTESRGSSTRVLDSDHQLLYSRPAAKVIHTADDLAQILSYTHQAAKVSAGTSEESRTLLDMRA